MSRHVLAALCALGGLCVNFFLLLGALPSNMRRSLLRFLYFLCFLNALYFLSACSRKPHITIAPGPQCPHLRRP